MVVSHFEMFLMNPIAVSRWWSSSAGQAKVVRLVQRPQLPQKTLPQSLHLKILKEPSGILLQAGQHFIARMQDLIPAKIVGLSLKFSAHWAALPEGFSPRSFRSWGTQS
jgi:hypothetical protein